MSFKSLVIARIAENVLSEKRLLAKRKKAEKSRQRQKLEHVVEFFHDPTDPYSQLLATVIPTFEERYSVTVKKHLVSPPDADATPEAKFLRTYSRKDTQLLAKKAGLEFTFHEGEKANNTDQADQMRRKLGHYLGAMLYYGGEWYWGLDRLHYIECRLKELGLATIDQAAPIFASPNIPALTTPNKFEHAPTIHFYFSFRSPYSAISADRIEALAKNYGAKINPRFVLPMVMRGLPVPKPKARYIIHDTAREARRLDIPFGRICDPLGKPVERGYSLLPWARENGREFDFVKNYLRMVWSQGVDAGSDRGMKRIIEASGLNWSQARLVLGNEDWRQEAEDNRLEMIDHRIWGVPSFRIDDVITWGQDRMWVIEDELKRLTTDNRKARV